MSYFYVFLGGGIGSILRFVVQRLFSGTNNFPFSTLVSNIVSCFIFGFVVGAFSKGQMSEAQKLFWTPGLCGGFSTFSAFSAESFKLLESGNHLYFVLNVAGSVLLCLVAYYIGSRYC